MPWGSLIVVVNKKLKTKKTGKKNFKKRGKGRKKMKKRVCTVYDVE